MRDEIVGNFYNIYDAVFPTVNILDLTDGIYKDSQTSYEQAQSNQLNWLLDQINCGERSVVLDVGCGYRFKGHSRKTGLLRGRISRDHRLPKGKAGMEIKGLGRN